MFVFSFVEEDADVEWQESWIEKKKGTVQCRKEFVNMHALKTGSQKNNVQELHV